MADTTSNPNTTQTPIPAKKAIFGGNQAAFDNLEKFEQLTNPIDSDETIDFEFDEFLDQEQAAKIEKNADQDGEYTFPEPKKEEKADGDQDGDDFILPSAEAEIPSNTENVFEAAIQSPKAEEDSFQMPFEAPDELQPQEAVSAPESFEEAKEEKEEIKEEVEKPEFEEADLAFEDNLDLTETSVQEPDFSSFSDETETEQELPPSPLSPELQKATSAKNSETPVEKTVEMPQIEEASAEETSEAITHSNQEKPEIAADLLAHQKLEAEPEVKQSKFMAKFSKLMKLTQQIFALHKSLDQEITEIEILGSNTQKSMIRYLVNEVPRTEGAMLQIKKIEKHYADNSETEHLLHLFPQKEGKNLMIIVDEFPLYEEEKDFSEPLKASVVNDKLNKFDLLLNEQLKSLEAQIAEKKAKAEQEKAFRTIFREF